jgi:hypothetical protein
MTTTPIKFGEVALTLHEQGWRPIPLRADTKQPAEPGWSRYNNEPWERRDLRLATIHHGDAACGIAIPNCVVALDLDIKDESAARQAEAAADKHLGTTPLVRIGQEPKSVRLYRSDGTVTSSKPHPVEIYSGSGQVAI